MDAAQCRADRRVVERRGPAAGRTTVRALSAACSPSTCPACSGPRMSGVVIDSGDSRGGKAFAVGDRVIGRLDKSGAMAEYVTALVDLLVAAPTRIPLADAAAIPVAGLTAWQAVFEHAHVTAGQRVLINGAGGGVGRFAVQLAKDAGATVIATASGRSAAASAGTAPTRSSTTRERPSLPRSTVRSTRSSASSRSLPRSPRAWPPASGPVALSSRSPRRSSRPPAWPSPPRCRQQRCHAADQAGRAHRCGRTQRRCHGVPPVVRPRTRSPQERGGSDPRQDHRHSLDRTGFLVPRVRDIFRTGSIPVPYRAHRAVRAPRSTGCPRPVAYKVPLGRPGPLGRGSPRRSRPGG
jgi:hypothetical protein